MQTYRYIQDPSHGWIEVPLDELENIAHKISRYSYMDKRTGKAYLEEDCDAAIFIKKLKDTDTPYDIKEVHQENTFIRNLPRFEYGFGA
tara:strand:- start:11424 stop:11690 length:267 start_codon:yes stop_codon:yes gene_type:complete